jgi:hypothetical protein
LDEDENDPIVDILYKIYSVFDRHKTKIYLISIGGAIAIAVFLGIKQSIESPLPPISTATGIAILILLCLYGAWYGFLHLMEWLDRKSM